MGTKLHNAAVALLALRRPLSVGMYLPDNDATRSALEALSLAVDGDADLLAEVKQCAADLEDAANILRRIYPRTSRALEGAAKRAKATAARATGGGQ